MSIGGDYGGGLYIARGLRQGIDWYDQRKKFAHEDEEDQRLAIHYSWELQARDHVSQYETEFTLAQRAGAQEDAEECERRAKTFSTCSHGVVNGVYSHVLDECKHPAPKTCRECKGLFVTYKYANGGSHVWCSRSCKDKAQRNLPVRKCKYCEESLPRNNWRFCSNECKIIYHEISSVILPVVDCLTRLTLSLHSRKVQALAGKVLDERGGSTTLNEKLLASKALQRMGVV